MELWDLYTKDRIKTGKTVLRANKLQDGEYHLVVHACIFNSNGELLIQKRQSTKSRWPNLWDITAAGSALAGESSAEAITREVYEEVGLEIDFENIRPHLSINFNNGFNDIYLLESYFDIKTLKLQAEEVAEVKWANLDDIHELLENNEFIPYYKNLINLFFDMRKKYGAFK